MEVCTMASRWCFSVGKAFLMTIFEISSGPGALLGDRLLMAFSSWWRVICVTIGAGEGYCVPLILLRSAGGGGGKKAAWNLADFSSLDDALSIVGM
jgi:hypothetical protein